jgi:hypothetical protein
MLFLVLALVGWVVSPMLPVPKAARITMQFIFALFFLGGLAAMLPNCRGMGR